MQGETTSADSLSGHDDAVRHDPSAPVGLSRPSRRAGCPPVPRPTCSRSAACSTRCSRARARSIATTSMDTMTAICARTRRRSPRACTPRPDSAALVLRFYLEKGAGERLESARLSCTRSRSPRRPPRRSRPRTTGDPAEARVDSPTFLRIRSGADAFTARASRPTVTRSSTAPRGKASRSRPLWMHLGGTEGRSLGPQHRPARGRAGRRDGDRPRAARGRRSSRQHARACPAAARRSRSSSVDEADWDPTATARRRSCAEAGDSLPDRVPDRQVVFLATSGWISHKGVP